MDRSKTIVEYRRLGRKPLVPRPQAPPVIAPPTRADRIEDFLTRTGATIVPDSTHATYLHGDMGTDEIRMPPRASYPTEDDYYRILFHELIHWTAPRLKRPTFGLPVEDNRHAEEELACEMGAALLCRHFGIDRTTEHAAYLDNWLGRFPNKTERLIRASQRAHRAVTYLLAL